MQKAGRVDAKGFSLVEVLIVLLILSFLSTMMIVAITGARRIGTTAQSNSVAQQKNRYVMNIMERDFRLAGAGIYEDVFRSNNNNSNQNPAKFAYSMTDASLGGFMIPPMEITNGTDSPVLSYLNPLEATIGLTSAFREPGTDVVTVYRKTNSGFSATVAKYKDDGGEVFEVQNMVDGERLLQLFNKLGGRPIVVCLVEANGAFGTLRAVTGIEKDADSYNFTMAPTNSINQPDEMKTFLTTLNKPTDRIDNSFFAQVSPVSYFVYTHPDPALGATGWLVRLDLAAIVAGAINVDANDPETLRPFVVSENISDFQVAVAVDSDIDNIISAAEWHNGEDMENYIHYIPTSGSASADYTDFINNLKTIRFSVVTYTDETAANSGVGFADPDGSKFSSIYPTVANVADFIGITPTLEDRAWDKDQLVTRLWFHRAVQMTKTTAIRNMDLENSFAREQ